MCLSVVTMKLEPEGKTCRQEYVIEREGEYPTSLWVCVTTLYLCNDIHRLEASFLAVCGHVAKTHVL